MFALILCAALGQASPEAPSATRPAGREVGPSAPGAEDSTDSSEPPSFAGLVELSAGQLAHGYLQGAMLCAHFRCGEPVGTLGPLLGAGLLGGAALYAGWPGLRPGTAMTVNWGMAFGAYGGLVGPGALAGRSPIPLAISAGAGVGAALGIVLSQALQPSSGQVALAAAGGYWTAAVALLVNASGNRSLEPGVMLFPLLGIGALGTVAAYVPDVGRLHVLVMDVSAFLLSQLALLVCRAFNPDPASYDRSFRQYMVAGGVVGLAGAWFVGRRFESLRAPQVALSVGPVVSEGRAGVSIGGSF